MSNLPKKFNKRWTPRDDDRLLQLVDIDGLLIRDAGKKLGRTENSCTFRLGLLRNTISHRSAKPAPVPNVVEQPTCNKTRRCAPVVYDCPPFTLWKIAMERLP